MQAVQLEEVAELAAADLEAVAAAVGEEVRGGFLLSMSGHF